MKKKEPIRFINKDKSLFFATLNKRVDQYFKEKNISRNGNSTLFLKSVILLSAYILPFVFIIAFQPVFTTALLLWLLMGFAVAGVGMSVMHDGGHGSYSSNKKINYLMCHTVNLCGGSSFNWNLQHNVLHHTYTNVAHMDEDIDDKLVLRFSPHTNVKWFHKLQWLYAFLFYGILTLYWVILKDFVQFARYTKNGTNRNSAKKNAVILTKIVLVKVCYLFAFLGLPVLVSNIPFSEILIGFLAMHFVAGLILTVIFQLAHTVEGTSHPLANESGIIENDWAIHQMNTTVNFSRNNKLISWYVGGLNYQVEHHLFPRISHVHYPAISEIVKSTAEEFNIPYLENHTFGQAFRSHIALLQKFGKLPDINEAIA